MKLTKNQTLYLLKQREKFFKNSSVQNTRNLLKMLSVNKKIEKVLTDKINEILERRICQIIPYLENQIANETADMIIDQINGLSTGSIQSTSPKLNKFITLLGNELIKEITVVIDEILFIDR